MPKIYVVDVPEFSGLVRCAREQDGVSVSALRRGYFTISSRRELVGLRFQTGGLVHLSERGHRGADRGIWTRYTAYRGRCVKLKSTCAHIACEAAVEPRRG